VVREQHCELERGVDNATVVSAAIGSRRPGDVAALFEQQAEMVSGGAMAALVRAREPFFGLRKPLLLGELDGELKRTVRIVPLDRTIRGHGISQVTSPIVLARPTAMRRTLCRAADSARAEYRVLVRMVPKCRENPSAQTQKSFEVREPHTRPQCNREVLERDTIPVERPVARSRAQRNLGSWVVL
jgi:hypothetical protein